MFNALMIAHINCKIDLNTPITKENIDFSFKLNIQDAFVYGENSQLLRLENQTLFGDSLYLKSPTVCDSKIYRPSNLQITLFLKCYKIILSRYENEEYYIPNSAMLRVLKFIIKFGFEINCNDPIPTKYYLAALLGNIFHGTDFLTNLGPRDDCDTAGRIDYNRGRGVIQVYEKEAYQLITRLSSTTNYLRHPGSVAFYTESATLDSLKAYHKLCEDYAKANNITSGMTFYNTMQALKLDSLLAKRITGKFSDDITNRMKIYRRICRVFEISDYVGEPV